ncbi:MAG: AraC family transcriptional regulator [Halomonas sp.]|nr:AraC family transcriptional regulator [Halomonas sp.]
MTRAEIWLQDTLDKPLSIDDLAQHLGYSASQVRRQFRHYFHTTPSAYREKHGPCHAPADTLLRLHDAH